MEEAILNPIHRDLRLVHALRLRALLQNPVLSRPKV
jgi:hypothetical protein